MGVFSIILIILWAYLIFDGVYGIIKGVFHKEEKKVEKHEPKAYHKWVRISSVFFTLCGILNIVWIAMGAIYSDDNTYLIYTLITVAVCILLTAVTYRIIVKTADKKIGIQGEFSEILKESKKEEKEGKEDEKKN